MRGNGDMKLMSAKQQCSALNLDPERGGVVLGGILPKLNKLHARCKCHEEVTKKKSDWIGDARTEVWRKD